jgi:hypothetical protein
VVTVGLCSRLVIDDFCRKIPKKKARYRGLRRMKEVAGIRLLEKMVEKMSLNEGISVNQPRDNI